MLEIGTLTNRVMEQPWNQIYIIESESEDRFVTLYGTYRIVSQTGALQAGGSTRDSEWTSVDVALA